MTNSFAWSEEGGLYKLANGGTSWSKAQDQPRIGGVALRPGDSTTVLAFSQPWWSQTTAQVVGVHLSSDGGDLWEIANSDLKHIFVVTAAFNPHDPNQILVTTHGGGAWAGTFLQGSPGTPSNERPPDFNGSGLVDFAEFQLFATSFGKTQGKDRFVDAHDLNTSGEVDFGDFLIFAGAFGK